MVSTTTRVSGARLVTWRVASTPDIPGMFRSITTTSGRELAHHAKRLGPVGSLADDLDGLLLEQVAKTGPKEVVVVHQQDSERVCRAGWCRIRLLVHVSV